MIVKYLGLGLSLLLLIAVVVLWRREPLEVVYVDSAKLMNGYKAMVDARSEYAKKEKTWQANVDTLSSTVQRSIKNFEREMGTMTPKEQSLSRQLLTAKQKQLINYQRSIQSVAREESAKRTQVVVSQVDAFLSAYGKAHRYDLILVASSAGTIAYARPGLDITDEVLSELNKQYIPVKRP